MPFKIPVRRCPVLGGGIGFPRISPYESQNKIALSKQVPVEYVYGSLKANRVLGVNLKDLKIIHGYLCEGLWSTTNLQLY